MTSKSFSPKIWRKIVSSTIISRQAAHPNPLIEYLSTKGFAQRDFAERRWPLDLLSYRKSSIVSVHDNGMTPLHTRKVKILLVCPQELRKPYWYALKRYLNKISHLNCDFS